MKQNSQEEIWNSIAKPWSEFRLKPVDEVVNFLKDKSGKILDLGCGNGKHFSNISGKIYGVDFSENMLRFAREFAEKNNIKVDLIKSEACDLPFKDNFFDSAIFVAVLHCIDSKEKRKEALIELLRVLKPKAEAFITVWDYDQERFKNKPKESLISWKYNGKKYMRYYYLYEKEEFVNLLKETGFEIIKIFDKESPDGFYSKKNIVVVVRKPKND